MQIAGIEALEGPQDAVAKNMKILQERRDVMVDGLNDIGFEVKKPKATFYLWFKIPSSYKSSVEFSQALLDKTGVVMTPGVGFGEHGEGYARCAITQNKERLQEVIDRIKNSDIMK